MRGRGRSDNTPTGTCPVPSSLLTFTLLCIHSKVHLFLQMFSKQKCKSPRNENANVELWVLKSLRWSQRVSTKFQPGLAEKTTQILDDFLMFILHLFLQIILSTQIMTLQNNVYINRHLMKNLTSSYRCLPSTEGGPFTLGVTKLSSQQSQNFSISWSIPIKEYNIITLFTICTVLNELVQENSLWTVSKY